MELNLSTWLKDSHGLYDYEAPETKCETDTINIVKSSKVYRHVTSKCLNTVAMRTKVIPDDDPREMEPECIYIGSVIIEREKGDFRLQSATVTGVLPHPIIR